jgi:serine/threonine-protein kinase
MNPDDRFQSIAEFRDALRPPAPPQVRVAQNTTVLTPQPQAAAPAAAPARPPVAAPPAASNPPAQPAVQARPAAPAVPIGAAIATPAPQAQPRQRGGFGRFMRGLLVLVVVLGLIGATLAFAFPSIVDQVLPGVISAPQPTAAPVQTIYVPAGTFTLQDQEIIVPPGKEVLEAYQEAFIQLARQDPKYGPQAIVSPNAPPAFVGTPERISQDSQGTRYRATMQGLVYVPKS